MRLIVLILSLLITCRMARCEEEWRKLPLPAFTHLNIASFGSDVGITVKGIKDYISLYGKNGWLAGLNDSRLLNGDKPESSDQEIGIYRTCDVFLYVYMKLKKPEEKAFNANSNFNDRNKIIKQILLELEKMPAKELPDIVLYEK